MKKGCLIIISGSSGVGKNTVIKELIKRNDNFNFLCSYTTRTFIRENEENGKNYYFVSREEFERKINNNEMLEWDEIHGNYVGVAKESVENNIKNDSIMFKDLTLSGVNAFKNLLKDKVKIGTIFLTEKKDILKKRLIARGEPAIEKRLSIYEKEQQNAEYYDYIIKNSLIGLTCEKIEAIIEQVKNEEFLEPVRFKKKYISRKINKIVTNLKNGKKYKPIKVCLIDNKIKIVKNEYLYLASVISSINVAKIFVDKNNKKIKNNVKNNQWFEILNNRGLHEIKK